MYANRRRVQGGYGKQLLKKRGELIERSFAHVYNTGGMRRTHLRKHPNILKRQLIHIGAFNLSLILRRLMGAGTPREWKNRGGILLLFVYILLPRREAHAGAAKLASWPALRDSGGGTQLIGIPLYRRKSACSSVVPARIWNSPILQRWVALWGCQSAFANLPR